MMGRLTSSNRSLVLFLLYISIVYGNFERSHKDYDPNPVNMEMGWGAIHCIDLQEISTLWREVTFQPALVVTCELKSHQCITIRAVNSTHHYTFQGCIPQGRVSKVCTELAYAAANKNGAEYFYCYDVTYDRLNVPANMPLAGRECCCNGDFCNRIENVKTIDTIIPHDQILTPFLRTLHLWYWNTIRVVGLCSAFAIVFFWVNIVYIVLKPAEREDDSAWYAAPIPRNLINDDDNLDEEEGEEVVDTAIIDIAAAEAKQTKDVEASKKKKKGAKKRLSKEDTPDAKLPLQTEKTQECSNEDSTLPAAKTGDDEIDEKKDEKKAAKEKGGKEKKEKGETPIDDKEKKTQEPDPKKEEEEGGKQFKLCKPKKLANGRVQYVSMFNENSDYSDDEDEKV